MPNHHFMAMPILILIIPLVLLFPSFSFSTPYIYSMSEGSSLSVEKPDNVLISPNGVFSAGLLLCYWYREPLYDGSHTTVWMANQDQPINGRLSKLTLLKNGNLILTDARQFNVWATKMNFQSPADTFISYQPLTRNTKLVSSRSQTNYSSSFYKLFFDDKNVSCLVYNSLDLSSLYWPDPWLNNWNAGRSSYSCSKIIVFNSSGHFKSTDDFQFTAIDSGIQIRED
ncbi:putative receptor protein kinase ZmPK1 [Camellia lanceoleosa]|uniref:Receptor protein kinase ZmPK1 n=1 Tax=Camellia lanceoleosa TaxID=1840588 RepID=A0ACC0HLC0_9ERIC|nr:putative receptor protein kinase ZmPK1 [Camellia lanceoleosa]